MNTHLQVALTELQRATAGAAEFLAEVDQPAACESLPFVRCAPYLELVPPAGACTFADGARAGDACAAEFATWVAGVGEIDMCDVALLAVDTMHGSGARRATAAQRGMAERVLQLLCGLAVIGARATDPQAFGATAALGGCVPLVRARGAA